MHRFHLPPSACRERILTLSEGESHHAARVLRVARGEVVTVLDGAGRELQAAVEEISSKRVRLQVLRSVLVPPLPYRITLFQAIPKGKLLESVLQKATELGVHRVVPLITDRVISRPDQERAASKVEHWRQIAIEAIKQCGSAWLPHVEPPHTIPEWLARRETFDLPLVGALAGERRHPRVWFDQFTQANGRPPESLAVWIGPEGDFTAAEVEMICAAGARPITLGRLVLRTETAAIYALAIMNYELQARWPS